MGGRYLCLLDQPFVKDPNKTVGERLKETIATIGENFVILASFAGNLAKA